MGKKDLVHVGSVRARPGCIEYDLPPLEKAREFDEDELPHHLDVIEPGDTVALVLLRG